MIAANRIGSAPGSRATDIISGADGGTLVLSRTRCLHYAASRRSPPDTAWPGRRPSLIPSRRARAPYRGTRENNLPTPLCHEPPILLTRGHFFHPPLARGRCLYPPDKGVALVEGFFIGHSPRDARPLKGGVVHVRRSRNRPQVRFRPSRRSGLARHPVGAVREPPCLGDEERGDAGIVNRAASGLYVFHDILRY